MEDSDTPMNVELRKEYRFEAAHFLPRVPPGHKCARMHGHSYRIELQVTGPVNPDTGWLIDFAVIDDAWEGLFTKLDHHTLNEVPGLENSHLREPGRLHLGGRAANACRRCRR